MNREQLLKDIAKNITAKEDRLTELVNEREEWEGLRDNAFHRTFVNHADLKKAYQDLYDKADKKINKLTKNLRSLREEQVKLRARWRRGYG